MIRRRICAAFFVFGGYMGRAIFFGLVLFTALLLAALELYKDKQERKK